ncbi:MAG: hypothetical protein NTV79_02920, partial [Candidatus Aureabacteria bacterium]|nr:hypothetical protein [Candidatus Auribacterota bacterium]
LSSAETDNVAAIDAKTAQRYTAIFFMIDTSPFPLPGGMGLVSFRTTYTLLRVYCFVFGGAIRAIYIPTRLAG